ICLTPRLDFRFLSTKGVRNVKSGSAGNRKPMMYPNRAILEVFFLMRALIQTRSRHATRIALLPLVFLFPTLLPAPYVPVTTAGPVSLVGGSSIYNGQYVLSASEFGFFWLNTAALQGGQIQAISKCSPYWPDSVTNIYVAGDCNSTSGPISS